jgi:hypothetical protein
MQNYSSKPIQNGKAGFLLSQQACSYADSKLQSISFA